MNPIDKNQENVSNENSGYNLVTILAIAGSISLGIGAIYFVYENWAHMSNILKTFLLIGATSTAYGIGCYFRYFRQNFPLIGDALIFLSTLMFGATIFLIAQMYQMQAKPHELILLWLLGIVPHIYVFVSPPVSVLSALLFLTWINLFYETQQGCPGSICVDNLFRLPVFYLVGGIVLFSFGTLLYAEDRLKNIAGIYRFFGILTSTISLFNLTYTTFSGGFYRDEQFYSHVIATSEKFVAPTSGLVTLFITLSIIAALMTMTTLFFNPARTNISVFESLSSLALLGFTSLFFFNYQAMPLFRVLMGNSFTLFFNGILIAEALACVYIGRKTDNNFLTKYGLVLSIIFILARFYDYSLSRALFFLLTGALLVLLGVIFEWTREKTNALSNK